MTLRTFWLLLTGVLLNSAAQLFLKAGVIPLGPISLGWSTIGSNASRVMGQWQIFAGFACYAVSVWVWIVALSRVDVSLAYPMLSLGYVVNAAAAWYLFGELIGPMRSGGIVLILAGVALISKS